MSDGNGFTIECGPPDNMGRRAVTAVLGKLSHRDRFDIDDAFRRAKFREKIISKFEFGEDAHEHIEAKIIAAADKGEEFATLNTINVADVHARSVKWFWDKVIPAAAITDLSGDPNEGKSTAFCDLAARNSRGDCPPPHTAPDGTFTPGNTLIISGEDDFERTIKPRLVAAGADCDRIHLLRTVTVCGDVRHIQLPTDLPAIERFIVDNKINLVGIDVLSAFTEPNVSLNDDAAMRRLLTPMAGVAERTLAAIIVLRHMNKKQNTPAMYRAGGSIAITGACRAAFAIAPNPDDPDEKIFVPIKHNLGPRPHSLTFRIEAAGDSSRIVWGGQSDLTAADVLKGQPDAKGGNKFEQAKAIIADVLSGGPRGENEVKGACEAADISSSTYWRARRSLDVQSEKAGYHDGWILSLPNVSTGGTVPF